MTAIIILNWNGADDTIECLRSLYDSGESNWFVMLADNGSTDDSVQCVTGWIEQENIRHRTIHRGERLAEQPQPGDCVIVLNGENLGFAAGNNAATECLADVMPSHVMLLNNDTIVTRRFLSTLTDFMAAHPDYVAVTPRIHYKNPSDLVWNCGGKLWPGYRKYYYARRSASEIREYGHIDITFITGCALLAKSELLDSRCHLLTDRFFFGEEDFDFSTRMKRQGHRMACVLDSLIYHKVSASTKPEGRLSRILLHYVNRTVNMRLQYGALFCVFWYPLQIANLWLIMRRQHRTWGEISRLTRRINHDGWTMTSVPKSYFDSIADFH